MILVAYSVLYSGGKTSLAGKNPAVVLDAFAIFGLLVAASWLYASHRHWIYFKAIRTKVSETFSEYRDIRAQAPHGKVSPTSVIIYALPGITIAIWVALLIAG